MYYIDATLEYDVRALQYTHRMHVCGSTLSLYILAEILKSPHLAKYKMADHSDKSIPNIGIVTSVLSFA